MALDKVGGRLAVYHWESAAGDNEEFVSFFDLKTLQPQGRFGIEVQSPSRTRGGWGGAGLSWWGPSHVVLWKGQLTALVMNDSGDILREIVPAMFGRFGPVDAEDRLWCEFKSFTPRVGQLVAFPFPLEDVERHPGLEGRFFPRWHLTHNGLETQAAPGDARTLPRLGPAR
jgi:hypothetical protein